ncbi:MAG TPA: signal peptidase I [Mycobacterium sp.]
MNPAEPDPAAGGAPLDRVPAEASQPASETPPAATEAFPLPEPQQAPPVQPPAKRQMNPVLELVLILAAALGLWYVTNGWIVKPYRIPSASMEPTLQSGDRVLVNRFIYRFHDPRRGDIIVFHPPGSGDEAIAGASTEASVYFIKRIVGLPGETVEGRNGHVEICAKPNVGCHILNEPYLTQAAAPTNFGPIRIAHGHYFMMGDNRAISDDSRDWGTLPRSYIIGKAFATYWPLDRIRTL